MKDKILIDLVLIVFVVYWLLKYLEDEDELIICWLDFGCMIKVCDNFCFVCELFISLLLK